MRKRLGYLAGVIVLLCIPGLLLQIWQATTKCLHPFTSLIPFPMPPEGASTFAAMMYNQSQYPMPGWWKRVGAASRPAGDLTGVAWKTALQGEDVWLMYSSAIQRYKPESGEHYDYSIVDGDREIDIVYDMLIARDKKIWAVVRLASEFDLRLIVFDEQRNSFVTVQDRDNILSTWKASVIRGRSGLRETADGNIVTFFQKNILLYSPQTTIAQLLLPEDFRLTVNSIAISEDNLWFTVEETIDLWRLDLSTKDVSNYGHAPILGKGDYLDNFIQDEYDAIAVDSLGRVWMGYFARLQTDENGQYVWWYPNAYPAEFIMVGSEGGYHRYFWEGDYYYLWANVHSVYLASDNNLWFSTSAGLVKYDTSRNTWCLSAPGGLASVTEDERGNLWIVPYNTQYQNVYWYKIQP